MTKINLDKKTKKDYGDLSYRIFISILVGFIPIFLMYSLTSVLDCNEVKVEMRDECIASNQTAQYASYVLGGLMFACAFQGVLWEWKRNQELMMDRSPLKLNVFSSQEKINDSKLVKERLENETIRKKYENMEDLS